MAARVLVSVALRAARVALAIFFICLALAVMSVLVFLIFLAVSWAREVWARASVDTASLIMRETSSALALISSLRALRSRKICRLYLLDRPNYSTVQQRLLDQ